MANRMNGKIALVTGAGSGMGKAIALAFLQEGAKVAAQDIVSGRLEELKEEAAELGFRDELVTIVGNVCSNEDCEAAVRLCVETFGGMNVLSHNAGVSDKMHLVTGVPDEEWDRVIAINLTGSMRVTRAALRYFMEQAEANGGEYEASIVMITSKIGRASCRERV